MANHENLKKDAVRIKVIQHSSIEVDSQCCRFSVAPELTNYEVLRNLIVRAFDIKGDFTTYYLARDERFTEACWVPLLSDFDLELAFQRSSDPYLLVKVDLIATSNGMWDVSNIDLPKLSLPDIPKNNYSVKLPGIFKEKMEKTISIVQKAFNWNEDESDPLPPRPPLTDSEFQKMLDTLGTLKDPKELRLRVKVVWKHLLNVYPDNLTGRQRMDYMKERTNEYYRLRKIWQDHLENSNNVSEEVNYITNMVRKDVLRTDRHHPFFSGADDNSNVKSLFNILTTYSLNHPSVGYCQGMSDLASPLLVTMKDEAQAYVCFCSLMSRVNSNFHIDGDAMTLKFQHLTEALLYYDAEFFSYLQHHQADDLLFCYRWLLLELKREFAFDDAQFMLEVLWSSIPPNPPEKSLDLVPFNPVKVAPSVPSTPRQNHYANVCALRRQRSCVSNKSAESLAAILHRRAASVDFPNSISQHVLNRTFSQSNNHDFKLRNSMSEGECATSPISPVHGIKEESSSPEDSPSRSVRKIKDLKEFKKLTYKKDGAKGNENSLESTLQKRNNSDGLPRQNGTKDMFSETRRCYSDSDADIGVPVIDGGDVDVWQNPISTVSPEDESQLEIVAQEEKPSSINVSQATKCKSDTEPESASMASSVNSCEEVIETGWHVTIGGIEEVTTLPPPEEFGGGNPFLMFLCVTLLMQHRHFIIQHKMDHNELAMHFDKMVRKHNVRKVLAQARKMFEAYLKMDFSKSRTKATTPTNSVVDESC
ncbi:TBC1 domain family member 25 [Armadillidium vulgare]|nr:TBC1 domain family member 25 [Armadillidium vulgare]